MQSYSEIQKNFQNELKFFNKYFNNSIKNNVPFLSILVNYILRRKGKQLRPLLVLLSSKMVSDINESTYNAATMIELLHTATLVHDDIIDESYERRSSFSINALWKSKAGVLIGDYLLARGLLIGIKNKEYTLLEIISETVELMSEGEIQQMKKSRQLNIKEDEYFEIISKKTASLMAACMGCGAAAVTDDKQTIENLKTIGNNIGLAFQIKDDLFSFSKNSSGKPNYNDFKEKKITLPLIYSISNAPKKKASEIKKILNRRNNSLTDYKKIIDFANEYSGIEYAIRKMNEIKDNAKSMILNYPPSIARDSLLDLIEYVVNRKI